MEGACLCGAVRFEIVAGARFAWAAYCHCSICRKQHGALFSTSVGVPVQAFRWTTPSAHIARFRISAAFERPFCRHCGSKVPAASLVPGVLNVPAGTLNDERVVRPRSHIFVGSKSPLSAITDTLPRHQAYPPGYAEPEVPAPARELRDGAVLGSCLCNGVGYAVEGALERIEHCHCRRCRRSSGSAFKTFARVPSARFAVIRNDTGIVRFTLPHEEPYDAAFCSRCGSLLPAAEGLRDVLIPAASIDTPVEPLPFRHLRAADKAPWQEIDG